MQFLIFIAIGLIVALLVRVWTGVMNVSTIESQSLANVEHKHPFLPQVGITVAAGLITTLLLIVSFTYSDHARELFGRYSSAIYRTTFVFILIAVFSMFDHERWHGLADRYKHFLAFIIGSVVTWILILFKRAFFETGIHNDPFIMALGITCVIIGWRFLFGPWSASMKATVLGTFLFWVSYAILRHKSNAELLATAIAACVALLPAAGWCWLFLSYHRQRMSVVFLAFFAGMMSTAPILFYDAITRRAIEFHFFLFKVVPVNFSGSSTQFANESVFGSVSGVQSAVIGIFVTYLIVGIIEEISKYWVLQKSCQPSFRSIDDVMQLAIVTAIGFAFAENLLNPQYFIGFVQSYILQPTPKWGMFIGNVVGRGILTSMVHILSTGVLGYFFGVSLFASPLIREHFQRGKVHPILARIHTLLALKTESIFARYKLWQGMAYAFIIHGLFDFIVSLPDVLPGKPTTVGAILGMQPDAILSNISITLLPSILYVVGGFWLLTYLFERKEDMKEFGAIVEARTYVATNTNI